MAEYHELKESIIFLNSQGFIDIFYVFTSAFFTGIKGFFTPKKNSCFDLRGFSRNLMVPGKEQQLLRCISPIETQGEQHENE
jgi:hypothetical protein